MPVVVPSAGDGALVQRFVFPATIADVRPAAGRAGGAGRDARCSGRWQSRQGRSRVDALGFCGSPPSRPRSRTSERCLRLRPDRRRAEEIIRVRRPRERPNLTNPTEPLQGDDLAAVERLKDAFAGSRPRWAR